MAGPASTKGAGFALPLFVDKLVKDLIRFFSSNLLSGLAGAVVLFSLTNPNPMLGIIGEGIGDAAAVLYEFGILGEDTGVESNLAFFIFLLSSKLLSESLSLPLESESQ